MTPTAVFFTVCVLAIVAIIALSAFRAHLRQKARAEWEAEMYAKYGTRIGKDIISGRVWQGETDEQLRDSLGRPVDIDEKVLKTKRREIWKYRHQGANRYGLRITLENGAVVGWEEKS